VLNHISGSRAGIAGWFGRADLPSPKPFTGRNQARRGFNPRPEAVASVAVVAAASAVTGRWVRR
jgi:hypothetical protein